MLTAALGVLLERGQRVRPRHPHLLELVLLAWFWMTPIVYPYELVAEKLGANSWVRAAEPDDADRARASSGRSTASLRPTRSDGTRQAILPDESQWWYLRNVLIVLVVASVLLVVAIRVFDRLEGNVRGGDLMPMA